MLVALVSACGSGSGTSPSDGTTSSGDLGAAAVAASGNPAAVGGALGAGASVAAGGTSGTVVGTGSVAAAGAVGMTGGTAGTETFPPQPISIPLCAIEAQCTQAIRDEPKVLCTFAVADGAGATVYDDHAGIEIRGRSSQEYPKLNYSIELRTGDGVENSFGFFGMGGDPDWVLDGSWADRSFMRNDLVFDLFRSARSGNYAPECQYCTLQLNGQAQGIYRLCERIKRDDDRLDLAEDDGTGSSFVIKQDEEGDVTLGVGLQDELRLIYPNEEVATRAQINGIQAWLDGLRAALESSNPDDPSTGIFAYLDQGSTLDFVLVQELSKNIDAYNLSLHFAKDVAGKAQLVPWDLDLSMGQPTVRNEDNDGPEGWVANRTLLIEALERTEAVRSGLGARWRELRAGQLSDASVGAWMDSYLATLTPEALAENFALWPIEEVDFTEIYRPYSLYPVSSYDAEVAQLRAWIAGRLAWMDANIDAYPE